MLSLYLGHALQSKAQKTGKGILMNADQRATINMLLGDEIKGAGDWILTAKQLLSSLAGEGAEPTWDGNPDTAAEQAAEAGCAKPAGELPALPPGRSAGSLPERAIVYHADELRAYALRALRERA